MRVSKDTASSAEEWSALALQVLALTAVYLGTGRLALEYTFNQTIATLLWPPVGIALASLLIWGRRLWPGAWLGSFGSVALHGVPVPFAMGIATGTALMVFVGALLMERVFAFRASLERVRDVLVLVLVGGALAALIAASVGTTMVWLAGRVPTSEIGRVFSVWWRGDFGSVVAFAPLILLMQSDRPAWRRLFRNAEYWIATGVALALLWITFSGIASLGQERLAFRLVYLVLVWSAFRIGIRGAVVINAIVLFVSAVAFTQGLGPFALGDPYDGPEVFWLFLVTTSCTSMAFAAAVRQREVAEEQVKLDTIEKMRLEREQLINRERERIMREVHDGIGGQLTSVLSMLQRGGATTDEVSEAVRRTLDEMRIMIDSHDASSLSFSEMLGRLRARLDAVLRRNGLRAAWKVESSAALDALDPNQALHSIRIIQEAVANVVQHAGATEVEVRIHAPPDASHTAIAIEITDNGTGSMPRSPTGGRGIRNMKSRADALGAEFRFETGETGSTVALLIPLPGRQLSAP